MRILIVDDNKVVSQMIEKVIKTVENTLEIKIANSYSEAIELGSRERIDIAFLDVELESGDTQKNGIVFAKELIKQWPNVKIIFVTSYPVYAIQAFDVHAYDFVVKPIDVDRLKSSVLRTIEEIKRINELVDLYRLPQVPDKLLIKANREIRLINYSDILFVEKSGKAVVIQTKDSECEARYTLAELEELCPSYFMRTHKSFLVNLKKIKNIAEIGDRTYEILFYESKKIAILSRYKIQEFNDSIFNKMR